MATAQRPTGTVEDWDENTWFSALNVGATAKLNQPTSIGSAHHIANGFQRVNDFESTRVYLITPYRASDEGGSAPGGRLDDISPPTYTTSEEDYMANQPRPVNCHSQTVSPNEPVRQRTQPSGQLAIYREILVRQPFMGLSGVVRQFTARVREAFSSSSSFDNFGRHAAAREKR